MMYYFKKGQTKVIFLTEMKTNSVKITIIMLLVKLLVRLII